MSNERLRAAMLNAGLTVEQLAERIEVDPKSITRWVSGTPPYRRNQDRVAAVLGVAAHELWPDLVDAPPPPEPPSTPGEIRDEIDAVYLDSSDPELPDVSELLASATSRIDLLGLTLQHILADNGIRDVLAARADAGVQIRVLISDPDSVHLLATEHEQRVRRDLTQPPRLGRGAERSLGYLQPLLQRESVEARLFVASPGNTIIRVDDQMLVSLHLYGAPTAVQPILAVTRRSDRRLFARFAHHFDLIWNDIDAGQAADSERYPDPTENPDRYRIDPDQSAERYGGLGITPPPAATPSTAQRSSWRRRRS